MATEHWKKDRLCPVCGKTFKGTAKAQVCGSTCRGRLKRLIETGQKPEYYVMAKSKGQKVPLLFKPPKPLKPEEEIERPKIEYAEVTPESYDAPPLSSLVMDEVGQTAAPLTKEQKHTKWHEIEEQIKVELKKECPQKVHPKTFRLQQEMIVSDLKEYQKIFA